MFLYSVWKGTIDNITPFDTNLEKIIVYTLGCMLTIPAIILDIIILPFQIIGIIIWLITRRKK